MPHVKYLGMTRVIVGVTCQYRYQMSLY